MRLGEKHNDDAKENWRIENNLVDVLINETLNNLTARKNRPVEQFAK